MNKLLLAMVLATVLGCEASNKHPFQEPAQSPNIVKYSGVLKEIDPIGVDNSCPWFVFKFNDNRAVVGRMRSGDQFVFPVGSYVGITIHSGIVTAVETPDEVKAVKP